MHERLRRRRAAVALALFFLLAAPALAQSALRVDYTVEVRSVEESLFHVTAEVKNIDQPRLNLSLPVWTPGWYVIENYAKNILRFTITDAAGRRVQPRMTRKSTWSVDTRGQRSLRVDFDYRATVLGLNQAKIASDWAFFTGTQLFLEAEGHRRAPSRVRFVVPDGWQIQTALKETGEPNVFTAPDYDTLVDSTTVLGRFDVAQFQVQGKPHYFITVPAGAYPRDKAEALTRISARIAEAQGRIFGGLPYEKYLYIYFLLPAESNAAGGLEHNNSHVGFAPGAPAGRPEDLQGLIAHEFFHAWNVKRFRPAEMWPYDYATENYTPLLWYSEGLTNYYTQVTLYRAGLISGEQFLRGVERAMNGVESNPARDYISPADASTSTWLGYDTPVAFGISYYTQGQNLGALLDLSIIHDTQGRQGLDDVMRALDREFYGRGRGFTSDDLLAILKRLTGRDYNEFFRRYVFGVEVPPYDEILSWAGFRVEKTTRQAEAPGSARGQTAYRLEEVASPTPAQLRVRQRWLMTGH